MSTTLDRPITEPLRSGLTWKEKWTGPDGGLIRSWERGREMREERPDLGELAERGELPPLPWRGGIEGEPLMTKKYGSLQYLAMWQGLRAEDLHVTLDEDPELTCARTGIRVRFTADVTKFGGG